MSDSTLPARQSAQDLCLYLLGPPCVVWAGQPLIIPRRQTRALLFYLAAQRQAAPRERLCFLFWPDTLESVARRNLTHLLTHLRQALPAAGILQATTDGLGLDPLQAWSDAADFQRLCTVREPHRTEALRQAVDLYRGPFLAGFSLPDSPEFEAWSLQERYTLERLYLEALEALIEENTAQGAYDEAIVCAQRYLDCDELSEKVHGHLIELYAITGDRSAALRQFERCMVVLERELGVSPLPETRAAYEAARHGRRVSQAPAPPPVWTTLPSLDAPLIGRDEALERLQQAYAQAQSGHGRMVLVSGEPGIGKSRLVQEFVTGVQSEATVIAGSGHEPEQGLPYWPLIEALRPHLLARGRATLDLDRFYLAEVARLLPELHTLLPDLPDPLAVERGQEQSRLFLALACWLQELAARRPPLVLCLDDLHWADETTLSWLGYLARRIRHAPVLVLGTYRTEGSSAVAGLRAQWARLGLLQEIALEGLSQDEVLCLIHHLSGQAGSTERFSQHLHHETGGNPFFILETLRAMFEAGFLQQKGGGWTFAGDDVATRDDYKLPLPDTVNQAICDRVGCLDPQARQVLEAGAVLGHQFSFDLIYSTSGRSEGEVADALEALLARQVIAERPLCSGVYCFNHDLIRAVVYRDLSYGRRRLLHRRAGEALAKLRPDDAAALAWHFERAEDLRRAAEYALQAGCNARTIFAYAEAHTWFDKALALLGRDAVHRRDPEGLAANRRLRIEALHDRGWVFRLLGDMEAYMRDSQEITRLAGLLGDQYLLAQARWREASTHRWFCRYRQAVEAAEDSLRLSQAVGDPRLEAICWRELGLAAREAGDYQRAQAALERALDLFVRLDEAVYEIHVLGNLSTLHLYQGEYEQAMDLACCALARCDEQNLHFERRLPLGDLGAAAAAIGNLDLARQHLLESLSIARQIADRTQEIFCLGHLGWLYLREQEATTALEYLQGALALAEQIDSRTEQSWLHAGLAEAQWLADQPDAAVAHARRALELAQTYGQARDEELARRVLNGPGKG